MGTEKPISPVDARVLLWLAKAHRSNDFVSSRPPKGFRRLLSSNPPWAEDLFRVDFELPYEPRCLAVSRCGEVVAAGTKAGTVHVVCWCRKARSWKEVTYPRSLDRNPVGPKGRAELDREAIRAIGIADAATVVAGTGAGDFLIFDLSTDLRLKNHVASVAVTRHRGEGWFRRFIRMIPAAPHGVPLEEERPLMLGLTQGANVHLLTRKQGRYHAYTGDLRQFLPNWPRDTRLVDGAWEQDYLWLLGEDGYIYRYRWDEELCSERTLGCRAPANRGDWRYPVSYPHPTYELRRIAACREGLALLVSHHVTFLPFVTKDGEPRLESADPSSTRTSSPADIEARWVFIEQTTEFAVWTPFGGQDLAARPWKGVLKGWKAGSDPTWIVAGSAQPGLHWTRWRQRRPISSAALPNEAGVGHRSVLLAAFGMFAGGPNYLVTASRDHYLSISSLVHKSQTRHIIDRLIPRLLTEHGQNREEAVRQWSDLEDSHRTPGVAVWMLRARIYHDLRVLPAKKRRLPAVFQRADIGPMLETLAAADLRHLVQILFVSWTTSSHEVEEKSRVFKRWVLDILLRAFQLSPEEPRRLARLIYDGIARRTHKTKKDPGDAAIAPTSKATRPRQQQSKKVRAPARPGIWQTLGPFAGFLRKWIINGNTYAIKERELAARVRWNRACAYDLDAMVYLAKLTRRRFDSVWQAAETSIAGLPIWDLVAEPSGRFSIQSFTDGSLTTVSRGGHPIRWKAGPQIEASLNGKELQLLAGKHRLNHCLAVEFRGKYHHGPYVRRLVLHQVGDPNAPRYLLVGCFRGWRPEDYLQESVEQRPRMRPRLFALLLCPESAEDGKDIRSLEIAAVETRAVCDELYEIYHRGPEVKSATTFNYLAGTRGSWESVPKDGGGTLVAAPFVEIRIHLVDGEIKIDAPVPSRTKAAESGQRTARRAETTHNPCWCLTTIEVGKNLWLWAGFTDGRLRCYKRLPGPPGDELWIEGGGGGLDEDLRRGADRPQDRSIPCSAAIWQILYIKDTNMLAYGTADGVVGLVSMGALEDPVHRPWVHLLHSREVAPISSLMVLRERPLPGEGEELKPRLLSVSQDGYAALYHLLDPPGRPRGRFTFPGSWQDRFPFQRSAQAVAKIGEAGTGEVPTILVGTGEGEVYKHRLLMPRGTIRRREAASSFAELMAHERQMTRRHGGTDTTPTLASCVGSDKWQHYAWLRVLDTGGLEMVRLSFWLQLDEVGRDLLSQPDDPEMLRVYLRLLDELTREAYSRRPLGRDPAKILWEEASKVANRIAAEALGAGSDQQADELLGAYNQINVAVDDLCNRWIGSKQAIEARVLVHSFNVLFDWPDILLLAWLDPPQNARQSQRFLLLNAIHRRLGYGEYMVRLETLRVINRALRWAIFNLREVAGERRELQVGLLPLHRPSGPEQDRPVGFYELMSRVGHLAELHHDSLSPADPLTSEITRFFSLSILLVPECALIVGHTMSESRLLDRGAELSEAIVQQAENLALQLQLNLSVGLERFRAYCLPRIDLRSAKVDDSDWWRLMTKGGRESSRPPASLERITDADMLYEQYRALDAAHTLASLERGGSPAEAEGIAWLGEPTKDQDYLRHSHSYLCHLRKVRARIQDALERDLASVHLPDAPDPEASEICEEAIRGLGKADIFEPQRTHYRQIILAWRDHIERRARKAVAVLEAIDKFNRHIYRTSADNFMTNILELVMQVAPLSFDRTDSGPLSQRIDKALENGHPLLREIFRNGTELVEQTHLAGTLLALARYMLQESRDPAAAPLNLCSEVRMDEIETEIKNAAKRFRLEAKSLGQGFLPDEEAPGTRAIWRTVVNEWANNIDRHGRDPGDPQLRFAFTTEGRRRVILLSGVKPFSRCLTAERRRDLSRQEEEAVRRGEDGTLKAAGWLLDCAQETWQPRSQMIGPASASGMGMFLIQIICELVGLRAGIRIYDLRRDLSLRRKSSAETLKWPLCLEISWLFEDGEGGRA